MSTRISDARLNDLLVELYRSLVQYACEAGLWSTDGAEELQNTVQRLARRQKHDADRLIDLLKARRYRIDFGIYPVSYTGLHYVAIEYLCSRIIENQRRIVRELEQSESTFQGDAEARMLVQQISVSQREGLDELLAAKLPGNSREPAWMKL